MIVVSSCHLICKMTQLLKVEVLSLICLQLLCCALSPIRGMVCHFIFHLSCTTSDIASNHYNQLFSLWSSCVYICVGSFECANVTNVTRISAASVVVNWYYALSATSFDIKVIENASLVQQQMPDGTVYRVQSYANSNHAHAYLIVNLTATSQDLCFTVQPVNQDPFTTMSPSSGDRNMDDCPLECLPSSPQST